jgi:hypothetical protein
MNELEVTPIEDMIKELKRRNISFVFAYIDHLSFSTNHNGNYQWAIDSGGHYVLQKTLADMIDFWMEQLTQEQTRPGKGCDEHS